MSAEGSGYGLWWRGDATEPPGWVDDCGSHGPVSRAWCEACLKGRESPKRLYEIREWSYAAERPDRVEVHVRELVGEWWEVQATTTHGSRLMTRRRETRAEARVEVDNERRWREVASVRLVHVRRYALAKGGPR